MIYLNLFCLKGNNINWQQHPKVKPKNTVSVKNK